MIAIIIMINFLDESRGGKIELSPDETDEQTSRIDGSDPERLSFIKVERARIRIVLRSADGSQKGRFTSPSTISTSTDQNDPRLKSHPNVHCTYLTHAFCLNTTEYGAVYFIAIFTASD
jgi:hypothetical protein